MNKLSHIHGSKKGQQQPRRPHIAPDDLTSTSYANIMYGLAEGEIMGLADAGKSIKLDGTPLINDNGQPNFNNIKWDFRAGTLDQSHIAGFPAVENEQNIGVELRSDRPFVRAINNRELSAVRVRLNFNALREQDADGNIKGYAIEYAIDVQTDGGSFQEVLRQTVRGKSSQGYKKSHRIDLPNAGTAKRWTIRVRRITPNRNSDLISDTVHIDALTEIIDAKLSYPCTALLGLSYDAKTFANIAKLAVRLKGKIIQVPSNYNAEMRQYNGLWDGTFKPAYSNNPAWVFYDLCTHKRYGLGERLSGMVDKWRLYQIGQYCDELVDDGKGGQEPRFTVNVYIQKADDAYRVLQNLASVFRGLSFWDGQNIVVDSDTPKEPVYTFSPANVVGGEFAYTGTRARDRHTLVKVAWDNPENGFNTEYELIPDEGAIAKYGVRTLDISAFGCTSKGQAQRAGLWALKAEQLETQTVSFKTGLMGFIPQVGQVINIADNVFAGRAISGKIVAVSANKRQITLDRVAGKVGDTVTMNGTDGVQSAKITAVRGQVLTLNQPINAEPEHIWAVISDDLKLKQFRILTIAQNDDATFDITALEYNTQKYQVVDTGAVVVPQPYTVLKATPITAPNSVTLSANTRTVQGQAVTTLTINWEQVQEATAYIVEWRKDDGNWQTLPKVSGQSVDIDGVYAGKYIARVRAVDSYDNESLATTSQLTNIKGKTGKPPRLASLTVQGILFGMNLGWAFARGSDDTNFTEIQVSPNGQSNITTLGTFAYPTNKHEITGLQGGLTQFYRARIVDKLGNVSDWTAWVRGTTDASADKVLDILSGQIRDSHLDQTLRTPIAKIGTLESAVNAVNGQLPTLNGQIATLSGKTTALQNELNTAKSTLQTAVGNITTERNRITSAIRDISALQTANNTKTQEIANLTNMVGGHTSSIRELGVTTGDLSQKYSQLKTATDTANSEITAIKQTQSGQATSIEQLGARFDNLSVGGRNLLLNTHSPATARSKTSVWNYTAYRLSQPLVVGQTYTFSADVIFDEGRSSQVSVLSYKNSTMQEPQMQTVPVIGGKIKGSFVATVPNDDRLLFYAGVGGQTAGNVMTVRNAKLERGNVATDWAPAPEDIKADIDSKATIANLDTLRQTLTSADTALSQQISTMDTAYKSADRQLTANLASETTARTNTDTALGQRIDTLQTDYNSNKASVANQIKTLSDKDVATASQISQLNSTLSTHNQNITDATTLAGMITNGKLLHADVNFKRGWNGVGVYNNSGGVGVVIERVAKRSNNPTSSTHELMITRKANGVSTPQLGGFMQIINSAPNKTFVVKYLICLPMGYQLNVASNATGNGRIDKFIGNTQGTGKYETYLRYIQCGDTGSFSTSGHVYVSGNAPTTTDLVWYLAQIECYEVTDYQSVDNTVQELMSSATSSLNTLTNNQSTQATQLSQLTANVSTAQNTANNANSKADTATTKADNAQRTANDAVSRANTANSAITAEQKARADADSSLASQISALDTAYKSADNNLTARLAREETARASGDNANAQALRTLESTVNGIGGRVGTSESKIASLERTTSDLNGAIATAQSQLNAKFDNLAVGGRNLLLNSNFASNLSRWDNWGSATRTVDNQVLRLQANNTDPWRGVAQTILNISPQDKLILSFDARADVGNQIHFGVHHRSTSSILSQEWHTTIITSEWARYSVKLNSTANPQLSRIHLMIGGISRQPYDVQLRNLKLEKGNIATDWTPAPEDTQSQLDEKASTATLDEFKQSQATQTQATSQKLTQLESVLNGKASATALNNYYTKAEADTAISGRIDTFRASINTEIAKLQKAIKATELDLRHLDENTYYPVTFTGLSHVEPRLIRISRNLSQYLEKPTWASHNAGFTLLYECVVNGNGWGTIPVARDITTFTFAWIANNQSPLINIGQMTHTSQEYCYLRGGARYKLEAHESIVATIRTTSHSAHGQTVAPMSYNVNLVPKSDKQAVEAQISEERTARSNADNATAQKLSQLESGLNGKANATALDSLTTKVNQVDGKITAETAKIATLQTTVGGHTASIQQHAQSLNGLSAQWTLKVQSGNIVSGIGLASNNGVSDFAVRADKFYIASPSGQKGDTPFTVLTSPQVINGVRVPAGTYIKSAYIQHGSISMLHIADSIQSDNYVAGRSGWRLFKNGELEINSSFGDGTRIQLNSKGLTGWYANGQKAFELGIFN